MPHDRAAMPALPRLARLWPMLLLIAAAGAALRIAAAQGGLWLDEAWSAVFARDVATPAGVFLNIHHDNNHHLNTLWLQIAGIDSAPVAQRALSIVSGTAAIVVAALIVAPLGRAAALAAALLFALSPMLVTYGSEARGYAPMLLCLLGMILIAGRWLDAPDRAPPPALAVAVLAALGVQSQMTAVFGIAAILGWAAIDRWRAAGLRRGTFDAARLMLPAVSVSVLLLAAILWWLPGGRGLEFGNYQAFAAADLLAGLADLLRYSFSLPAGIAVSLLVACGWLARRSPRLPLYLLAILGLPLGVALLQLGNPGIPRYYLVSSAAMLLLAAEAIGSALVRPRWPRLGALLVIGAIVAASISADANLLTDRRADTSAAIAAIAARAPDGATIALDRPRASAVIEVAAAQAGYPVRIDRCGRFLFVDRDGDEPFPPAPDLCGARYRPIAARSPRGLSGTHWTLYERTP